MAQDQPTLNVIGLGAQDGLDQATSFMETTGTADSNIAMVWDPSFESWRQFGVRSQPYWILFDANGDLVGSKPGAVDIAFVEGAI